jgi:hypothetical protein
MTTLQLPDRLADELRIEAEQIGVTLADFLTQLLEEHRSGLPPAPSMDTDAVVTERLNAIYSIEDSALDPIVTHLQTLTIGPEPW